MQKADDNHENSDLESDLEFDPWEEEEFVDDPDEQILDQGAAQTQSPAPQEIQTDLPEDHPISEPAKQPKKKRSSAGLLLLIAIIGGGGAGGYYFLSQNSNSPDKPIVRLDTNIDSGSQNQNDSMATQTDVQGNMGIPTPAEDAQMQGGGAIESPQSSEQGVSSSETPVLTPFPENLEESTVELAPLDEAETDSEVISGTVNNAETINVETPQDDIEEAGIQDKNAPIALEEDDLLSKTELPPSQTKENPAETTEPVTQSIPDVKESPDPNDSPAQTDAAVTSTPNTEKAASESPKDIAVAAEKKKTAATVKEQVKQPAVKEKAPEWEIRGANPQSAVLYEKNSGETRTVEPGDFVKGLGKITKIDKEKGLWVVTGTQNKVNQ